MKELYLKRNKLCDLSFMLRSEQFNAYLNKEQLSLIIKNRKEVYKRFKFYDNYIKIGGKIKSEILHTEERWLLFSWYNGRW